ncbi:MAG: NAD(P)H-dependent glycerol-3-phosphate dehydrogenase [Arenicellales bacterium]
MTKNSGSSISVIGAGSWGTALAILLTRNLDSVKLWGRNSFKELSLNRCNRRYLPDIPFPRNLEISKEFDELIDPSLNILVVVPSHAFRETVENLRDSITDQGLDPEKTTIIWGTKGFDPGSGALLSDVVSEIFPTNRAYGAISGPSFATETAAGLPTGLTLACRTRQNAERLAHWFRTPTTRVYFSNDLVGVQIGGAVKNVMAIATGISDGLGYGANARAALITRGLAEMTRLGRAMGGQTETFNGLTGVGDLILTCTDNQSRNRRFGLGIGAGRPADEVVEEIGQEIEGIQTTKEVFNKAKEMDIEMPITEQVYQVLYHDLSPDVAVRHLLRREPRAEEG